MKKYLSRFVGLLCLVAISACGGAGVDGGKPPKPPLLDTSPFESFTNKQALDDYLHLVAQNKGSNNTGVMEDSGSSDQSGAEDATPTSEPSVQTGSQVETNTQVAGVDEGDIIKFAGNRLVILRDQHLLLFDIAGANASKPKLITDKELDVEFSSDGGGKGAWYDEMLVFDKKIVLIALRYHAQVIPADDADAVPLYATAIELLSFDMDANGALTEGKKIFIESNDYYSGATNYATRKIGNKLIVYSPFFAVNSFADDKTESRIPHQLELVDPVERLFKQVRPAVEYNNIYKGAASSAGYMLHIVYSFDVDGDMSNFQSAGVMGDYSPNYYVTDRHFYLNIAKWYFFGIDTADNEKTRSVLYQFQLEQKLLLKNETEIDGNISERFAMSENIGENDLNLVTIDRCQYVGDSSRWATIGEFNAIQLDTQTFEVKDSKSVSSESCWLSSVRFNGKYALLSPYGKGNMLLAKFDEEDVSLAGTDINASNTMMMQPYDGKKWLVVGMAYSTTSPYTLKIELGNIELDEQGVLVKTDSVTMGSDYTWSESFWNDHEFFFDPENEVFAIPYISYDNDSWAVEFGAQYFRFSGGALSELGAPVVQTEDSCTECWYGNSRIVRKGDYFYNLLGRQLKTIWINPKNDLVEEVADIRLFQ